MSLSRYRWKVIVLRQLWQEALQLAMTNDPDCYVAGIGCAKGLLFWG